MSLKINVDLALSHHSSVGEVGASWRGNQFSYKLSATIMPIYLFFSTTYLLIPAMSKTKSRHHNILHVCKKRLSIFLKSTNLPLCWGKLLACLGQDGGQYRLYT